MLLYCSFCGKSQDEVLCLVAGPTVFICDECVVLCSTIAERHRIVRLIREELETTPLIASAIEARSDATGTGAAEGESAVAATSGETPTPRAK